MPDTTLNSDLDRLEAVYRSNVHRVYGYVSVRVGRDDANDIVSEVFHAAALATRDGRGSDVSVAWLMAVAHNKVADHWRRSYRRQARRHLLVPRHEELVDFPADWAQNLQRERVVAALDALKPRDRALLVLHHVDGVRVRELADTSGSSESAIESALARARRRFRAAFEAGGTEHG